MRIISNKRWASSSGEDDLPDYPVNVAIAPYPQYHLSITVQGQKGPVPLNIRYIIASSQNQGAAPATPSIPPGDEVILYIHGEGSRAEEALDFIPALFTVGAAAGRSFTVIAFDQPSCGYSTMVPHLSVADMPPTTGHFIDTSPFAGSPILDFVENTIVTFVETLMAPFPNTITAVVGGSLGGHMALRLAASQKDWVRNVVAWSPASVWDHDVSLLGVSVPQRILSNPTLASRATDGPSPAWPASSEPPNLRPNFFYTVWCHDTFNPKDYENEAFGVAEALVAAGIIPEPITANAVVELGLKNLPTVPPQPTMWYRADWPSKPTYIEESRRDRREVYNTNFRQWHWRICEEMIGFTFDALAPSINKPLLLMVGESDQYPEVNFFPNVSRFATTLRGLGKALTVQDTGHSIHNERPYFLANELVRFAPRP